MEVAGLVNDFLDFERVLKLGLHVNHNEFDYYTVMMFSWIKEGLEDVRKH